MKKKLPPNFEKTHFKWLYFLFISLTYLGCLVLFDFFAGKILFKDNAFKNYPLPPYSTLITENQKKNFVKLDKDDVASYIVFDQHLGWSVGTNRAIDDSMYVSNSYGMRSFTDYNLHKPVGKIRIAAFGDSFTEAADVKNEDSWPYLLEQAVDNVEVLNFGVRAYGTDQAYLHYKRDGVKFKPDIVFIGFLVENIRRNVNRWRPAYEHNTGGLGVKPRFVVSGDSLKLIPNPIRSKKMLRQEIQNNTLFESIGENDYWYQKYKFAFNRRSILFYSNFAKLGWLIFEKYSRDLYSNYSDEHGELFQVSSRLLKKFYTDALEDGAGHALVLIFPGKMHLSDFAKTGIKAWKPLLEYFEMQGVEYLDLTDTLSQYYGGEPEIVYGHYSPFGNEIVKDALMVWLERNSNMISE